MCLGFGLRFRFRFEFGFGFGFGWFGFGLGFEFRFGSQFEKRSSLRLRLECGVPFGRASESSRPLHHAPYGAYTEGYARAHASSPEQGDEQHATRECLVLVMAARAEAGVREWSELLLWRSAATLSDTRWRMQTWRLGASIRAAG